MSFNEENEPTPKKKTVKGKKNLVDETIELSSSIRKKCLNDTRDISTTEQYVLSTRFQNTLKRAHDIGADYFLADQTKMRFPGVNTKIFNPHKLSIVPEIALAEGYDFEEMGMPETNDMTFGDISEIGPDMSFAEFEHSPKKQRLEEDLNPIEEVFEGNLLDDLQESIIFPDHHSKIIEFDAVEEIGETEGMSNNTTRTLELVKNEIKESEDSKMSFFKVSKNVEKSVAAKLFFEMLVLNTKDIIRIEQRDAFGDLVISLN
jgi:hypothetical protein